MRFPNLVKDEDFENKSKNGTKIFRYELDWSEFDKDNVKSREYWYDQCVLDTYDNKTKKLFKKIMDESDWSDFNRPGKYKDVYEKFQYVYMSHSYYKECKHFKKLALSEWNRNRSFDTSVRETCLGVSQSCIDLYFFLILDALNIWGKDFIDYDEDEEEEHIVLGILWRFRFWKHQTGSGLVISNSFYNIGDEEIEDFDIYKNLKKDLEDNNKWSIFKDEVPPYRGGHNED